MFCIFFLIDQITVNNYISIIILGTQVLSTMWATESNILVGLHDASYSIWYCPGEACMDPTVVALTKVTVDITYEFYLFNIKIKK